MPEACNVCIGIDVACAKRKRLPVCFVADDASSGQPLRVLTLPKAIARCIPRGVGNRAILDETPFRRLADETAEAIAEIADCMGWSIRRIAIDAPAAPPTEGTRSCEVELGRNGLSVFQTPAIAEWQVIHVKCAEHLRSGRSLVTLPNANRIWMLFGFELFASLHARVKAEIIEIYPHSIVRALLADCGHKTTPEGLISQLGAIAHRTGWHPDELEAALAKAVPGSRHDRLDAAWVASWPADGRRAYGNPMTPDDAIWVPR
jgi:predicted nuclease with RNAse H fold